MKRSEMIEIIYNCLKDNHFGQYGEFKKMAKDILDRIEDNGMLPPETKSLPSDFTNTGFSQEFLDEHEFKVNRWEPEDE